MKLTRDQEAYIIGGLGLLLLYLVTKDFWRPKEKTPPYALPYGSPGNMKAE